MRSYNRINRLHALQNEFLLEKVLRGDWGFDSFVMSDWGAVNDRVEGCKAGLELQMLDPTGWHNNQIVKAEFLMKRFLIVVLNALLMSFSELPMAKVKETLIKKLIIKLHEKLEKNDRHVLLLKKEQTVSFIGPYAKAPRYQGGGSSHISSFKVSNALDSARKINPNIAFAPGCEDEKR